MTDTIREIPIDSIKYIEEFYPRHGFDNDTVSRYRLSLDSLPPIQITHENILIDGYHRLIAHRIEQRSVIKATVEQLECEQVLWEATKRNSTHGLQLSMADKRKLARIFYDGNGKKQAEIAELLSVSPGSISKWVRDIKEKQDQERDDKIWNMWLACHTQEEIAKAIELSQKQVSVILTNIRKFKSEERYIHDSLQVFNLWNFHTCDDRYGMDYPGRIPGQIIENLLYYYTEPFDIVIDPMAGGGTTLDVCKMMNRRHQCYDISPPRDDIKQHDIMNGFPPETKGCDLIFLDPPYWKQKQAQYSTEETNLANLSLLGFYDAMDFVFQNAKTVLASNGHIAVIVGPTQESRKIYDHALRFTKMLGDHFHFINRIIVPYTTQQATGYHVSDAKENRYMLKLYRDLFVYKKHE